MKRIVKMYAFVFFLMLGTAFLILGPCTALGILATLLGLPELVGAILVLSAFVASVATALSGTYISFLEQRAVLVLS